MTGQSGASLIEVLVVLAIIVGGLLLALQVFPVGFGQIRASGNRTLATQLAEQAMGQANGDAANLPQGVVFKYFRGTSLVSSTEVDPDNLAPCTGYTEDNPCVINDSDANGKSISQYDKGELPYLSDVNKFRYIEGEAAKVPLPTPTAFGSGAVYACKFGPLLMDQSVGDPANVPSDKASRDAYGSFLRVTGAPLVGTNVDANPDQNGFDPRASTRLGGSQTYLIDYGSDEETVQVMFPARAALSPTPRQNPNRVFKVTITHDKGDNTLETVTVDVTVKDGPAPIWQAITVNSGNGDVPISDGIPGSDKVQREFQRIARPASGAPTWDADDPYQYMLLSDNIQTNANAGTNKVFANMGILAFNPSGGTYSETTTTGTTRSFTAYIDYSTLDWHILRDDREVPSALPIRTSNNITVVPIRTTLGNIRGFDETNADSTKYKGLYGIGTDADPQDVQVFNLDGSTGTPLVAGDFGNGTPTPDTADYYVQRSGKGGTFGTGTIYVNTSRLPLGAHLRILYKARGDWAVAVQKAYARYTPIADANDKSGFSPFIAKGSYQNYGRTFDPADAQLRFPLADVNKAFVATIQYTTADGRIRRLSPVQMVADGRGTAPAGTAGTFDQRYAYIPVVNYIPPSQKTDFLRAARWDVIGPISGVSLKTRVIWHDNDNIQNRWRVQDMDTFLTPDTL